MVNTLLFCMIIVVSDTMPQKLPVLGTLDGRNQRTLNREKGVDECDKMLYVYKIGTDILRYMKRNCVFDI